MQFAMRNVTDLTGPSQFRGGTFTQSDHRCSQLTYLLDRMFSNPSPHALPSDTATRPLVTILGAHLAGAQHVPVRGFAVSSDHAPTPMRLVAPLAIDLTALDEDDIEDIETPGMCSSGEAIWQDVVRMLVAREAAKAMHPASGTRRTSAA
jgi:hypothetical protein